MFVVRPVRKEDLGQLMDLSAMARAGLTTFPHNKRILKGRIDDSVHAFQKGATRPDGETYLFVMEDLVLRRIVGTCAIVAKIGGYHPSYTYQIKTQTRQSRSLGVKNQISYLELKKEYNGPTEIGTLFLNPHVRAKGLGRMLSLSRFLFLAQHSKLFERFVIAELRGLLDNKDCSPFWNAVGRHFFKVEFKKADLMSMEDKTFIAELVPRHPIYIPLLPESVRNSIGAVHKNTEPARSLLEQENFKFINEIDIFEAGPVVGCRLNSIRTVKQSRVLKVHKIVSRINQKTEYMVARVGSVDEFRVTKGFLRMPKSGLEISIETAQALGIQTGDKVRVATLYRN